MALDTSTPMVDDNNSLGLATHVAIAVVHHADHYLLGYRQTHQHQGNRYEFVGGKIEAHESKQQALKRELLEEVGLVITPSDRTQFLGSIKHSYPSESGKVDKKVHLHVFLVQLSHRSYTLLAGCTQGLEGQPLKWVTKSELLSGRYVMPKANQPILQWLECM